jgi:YD repeat-containing protein
MRNDRERLQDMLEANQKIEQYVYDDSGHIFHQDDDLIEVWIIHQVHGYFETDTEIVWRVVEKDLPVLKTQLEKILTELR